ncbi:chemotaxis protein CheW [Luteimonas composti]|uniref:Chemotaxis protein CheW n=1 Tax=Luteimonas composti TaxID=398257 RepID=A0ABT6MSI7_9GAMM|nr:chemotaxis protein CheW [Luteimonas composti]MDH7453622.1 chemotaxis protein CheW [Luteimonas composti]
MTTATSDIRAVLIQTEAARLLLPNATISEVLSYAEPDPIDNAPDWLLGTIRWRGWRLPLVAFAPFSGQGPEQGSLGHKVVVLKTLGGQATMPYFALLSRGFPRLVTVSRDRMLDDAEGQALAPGVRAQVRFNDEPALVPDIDGIELALRGALAA